MSSAQSTSSRMSMTSTMVNRKIYASRKADLSNSNIINSMREIRLPHLLENLEKTINAEGGFNESSVLYNQYIDKLYTNKCSEAEFLQVIRDGRECIELLNPKYHRLVRALLSMDWLGQSENVIMEYQKFLHDILSAHNKYVMFAIHQLISCWISANTNASAWKNGSPNDELKKTWKYVHEVIGDILDIIPLTLDKIMRAIEKQFPHFNKPAHIYSGYVYNMFWLLKYRPIFTNDLMDLLFKKLLELDTNTSKKDIEAHEYPDECDDEDIFELDPTKHYEEDEMKFPRAETLDLCMEQLLSYIENRHHSNKCRQNEIFPLLMKNFQSAILPTYNSHHIQFSIFYYCSFEPKIMDSFVKFLWSKVKNFNESTLIRRTAVCYIASFMGRAKYIPIKYIQTTLKELCQWAKDYIQQVHTSSNVNALKTHLLFYSICHAIFYIIAIRNEHLTSKKKDLTFLSDLQLGSIVKSSLNPLRVCPSATATIFASVTRKHQIVYCQTILERNARQKLATIYSNEIATPDQTLDTIFPFDPFMLTKSGKRIAPIYLQYTPNDSDDFADSQILSPNRKRTRVESITFDDDLYGFIDHKKAMKSIARSLEKDVHF